MPQGRRQGHRPVYEGEAPTIRAKGVLPAGHGEGVVISSNHGAGTGEGVVISPNHRAGAGRARSLRRTGWGARHLLLD